MLFTLKSLIFKTGSNNRVEYRPYERVKKTPTDKSVCESFFGLIHMLLTLKNLIFETESNERAEFEM